MVSPPSGGECSSHLGLPIAQFVCDSPQREAAPVLLPCPRPPSGLRGCVLPYLGQPGRLHVSTFSSGWKGGGSSQRDPQSLNDSSRPSLARGVVRRPSSSADPTTARATLMGPAVVAVPLPLLPPRRPRAEPSHVATLQCLLRKSGFSLGAALEMSGCVRASTSHLYQVKSMPPFP